LTIQKHWIILSSNSRKTGIQEVKRMLGERIRQYIVESGMKIGAVAERAEIPMNTFSAMINGKRRITAEEYFSICAALGLPLEYFAA
jgi:plasmid maintenance system antidote protein VapI